MATTTPGMVCAHHHLYSTLARGMPAPPHQPNGFGEILEQIWWRLDTALDLDMIRASALLGATEALMSVKGDFTAETVNAAFKGMKDFKTDILCKPWYYGEAPLHIPNNVDRTTTPKDGVMVQKEDCFPISDVDPPIKQVREIEAKGGNA